MTSRRARVLAGCPEARHDRVHVLAVEGQEPDDVALVRRPVALHELLCVAGDVHERLPLLRRAGREIEHQREIHVNEPRDVLRAFDVAAHPVHRFGNPAQHGSAVLWLWLWLTGTATDSTVARSLSTVGSSASTHVSL